MQVVSELTPKLKAAKKRLVDVEAASTRASTARPSTTSFRPTTTARNLAASLKDAKEDVQRLLESFIPILRMLQGKLLWDRKEYSKAENLLLRHFNYYDDNIGRNLNMGHILFVQEKDKFEDSILYYEHVVKKYAEVERLLKAPGSCQLMRFHTCLVNLVIGTLYCEKGNYEFGISRICKSLDPLEKNLCLDTWFYTKRCFLALAGKIAKLMFVMDRDMLRDVMDFLTNVERKGQGVPAAEEEELPSDDKVGFGEIREPVTISWEARQLRHLFVKLSA